MATKETKESAARIVSHREAKGVDIAGNFQNYIIRSDLGCFMCVTQNLDREQECTIFPLHPTCANGDQYFSYHIREMDLISSSNTDRMFYYVIKGNSCRQVEDLSTDANARVSDVHKDCQNGDFYMASHLGAPAFIIIYAKDWTFRAVSDLKSAEPSSFYKDIYHHSGPYNIHNNCKEGLYYWTVDIGNVFASTTNFKIIKGINEWGVEIHGTLDLTTDDGGYDETITRSITNFLPGGLGVTMGVPTGQWHLIKSIRNDDSDTPLEWSEKISKKVGHKKDFTKSMMTNWKITDKVSEEITVGLNIESILNLSSKTEFSRTTSAGGETIDASHEEWEEEKTVTEKLQATVKPKSSIHIWQYIMGFRKQDAFQEVLYSKYLKVTDTTGTPTDVPDPLKAPSEKKAV